MAFKENLLSKIRIDQLAGQVRASIGPEGSEAKLDKNAMRQLLAMSPYVHRRERDLDLYVEDTAAAVKKILVLDNELPIYRTTIEDVAMRKSPEVGEMVKIRNIVKILRDSDVTSPRTTWNMSLAPTSAWSLAPTSRMPIVSGERFLASRRASAPLMPGRFCAEIMTLMGVSPSVVNASLPLVAQCTV